MMMKKIILAIYLLSILNYTISQNENADAEYLKLEKKYTLNTDGSIDYRCSKSLKLLTHFAFHRLYGETFILYNTDFQKLKINSAYTVMSDGKNTTTPKNAFNQVLPRFSTNAPYYNNIREMVVTHTGLEKGAIINLDYTIHTKKGFYQELMGNEILTTSSHVNELTIIVEVPSEQLLNLRLLNIAGAPVISNTESSTIYTWKFNSLPANSKDSFQEYDELSAPRLIFSTTDLQSALSYFTNQSGFDFHANNSMKETVTKITDNENDQLRIALEIQKIVCNNLNNLNIPLQYTGFSCRTPEETWNSNQGTQLEKVLLLKSMLEIANIKVDPVVIIPTDFFDRKVGDLKSFNNFLVKLKLKKHGIIYLSANHTNNQNQLLNLGNSVAIVLNKDVKKLKFVINNVKMSGILLEGVFDFQKEDTLLGNMQLHLANYANPYFSILTDSLHAKSMLRGGVSSSNIITNEVKKISRDISSMVLDFEKSNPGTKHGNYTDFAIPYISNGVSSWHMDILPAERNTVLEVPMMIDENYKFAIKLPSGAKLVSKLNNVEISNDVGYLQIKYEKVETGVVITRHIIVNRNIILPSDYQAFRELIVEWYNANSRKLVFRN
jgi:uncharacterized protein DUF3858/uncharacterized protein DUF3857